MGMADLVPGVSGGTVAFIVGIYEDLLHSIGTLNGQNLKKLLKGQWRDFHRSIAWQYLLVLGMGIGFSFISLSRPIYRCLQDPFCRPLLFSAFLGFVLASILLCLRRLKKRERQHAIGLIVGACIAFLGSQSFVPPSSQSSRVLYQVPLEVQLADEVEVRNYDKEKRLLRDADASLISALLSKGVIEEQTPLFDSTGKAVSAIAVAQPKDMMWIQPWIIFCGSLAACAMLLPGISGSYLLHTLGLYTLVIGSVADLSGGLFTGKVDVFACAFLLNLSMGILCGGLAFARVISWLLDHYHETTLSVLIGFMLGALPGLWPFWSYAYEVQPLRLHKGLLLVQEQAILPDWSQPIGGIATFTGIAAFILVLFIERLAHKSDRAEN